MSDEPKVKLGCGSCLGPNEWTEAYGAIPGWQPVPEQTPDPTVISEQRGWLPAAERAKLGRTRTLGDRAVESAGPPWRPCTCNPRREAWERGELRPTRQRAPETPAARAAREVARRTAELHDYA